MLPRMMLFATKVVAGGNPLRAPTEVTTSDLCTIVWYSINYYNTSMEIIIDSTTILLIYNNSLDNNNSQTKVESRLTAGLGVLISLVCVAILHGSLAWR